MVFVCFNKLLQCFFHFSTISHFWFYSLSEVTHSLIDLLVGFSLDDIKLIPRQFLPCVPGPVRSALQASFLYITSTTAWSRCYCYSHFTDKETEAQGDYISGPRSHWMGLAIWTQAIWLQSWAQALSLSKRQYFWNISMVYGTKESKRE